jgi:hypothetical protein
MADAPLPALLRKRDRTRIDAYANNLRFYNGAQWPTDRTTRTRRRLTINYTKPIIHKATASLLRGRTTTVNPADDTDDAIAHADLIETALAQVHEQNALDQLDFDTELDCAVLGDGVYKLWWDTDNNMVRVSAPDPAGIFAWSWPDDPSRLWRVAHQYKLASDAAAATLPLTTAGTAALSPRTDNVITDVWTNDTYERWVNDAIDTATANPYALIPFVIFPNIREPKQLWGTSDIVALRDPQTELNRALTQLSLLMELSGNPIAVLEGVTEAQDIAVSPGQVWELPKDAKAYLLDLLAHGGAKLHIDYIDAVYRALYDVGETPRTAFGGTSSNLSGVALELDLDPLVKKVERKRLLRTSAYLHRNDIILSILRLFAELPDMNGATHAIVWGSILPTDRDREVANEVALTAAGVHSRRFATDQLGGISDPDAEFERWLDEQRQAAAATPTPTPAP